MNKNQVIKRNFISAISFFFLVTFFSMSVCAKKINMMDFLQNPGSFNRLLIEFRSVDLDDLLSKGKLTGGKYTIFAPTDKAFNEFGKMGLLRGANKDAEKKRSLKKFLQYHIVRKKISRKRLKRRPGRKIKTLSGARFKVGDILGNILYSVETADGFVHVMNKVLINPDVKDDLGL